MTHQNKELPRDVLLQEKTTLVSALYTPSQFMPYNPASLYQKNTSYDIYDDMRKDEQIKATLSLKKNIILSKGWEIKTEDENQFEEEKNFLIDNLKYWLDQSFDQILMEILTALDYGYSLSEVIFEIWKDKLIIKDIKTRPPHSFLFYQDDFGNIIKLVQQDFGFKQIELNPDKFIHFVFQKEFQNPYGKSDLESSYTPWWSKSIIIKFFNIYLERNAVPPTIGQYPKTAGSDLRTRFLTLLDNLQNKSSMVLPEDFKVQLLEATRSSSPDFEKAIDMYNLMISRSLLMPDLLGMAGSQTGGGSYSLGQKHFDMFMLIIEKIQRDLERVINNSLVRPFFKLNFGIEENYPKFHLVKHSDKNQKELSDLWIKAVQTGVIEANAEEKSHFREVIGYPDNPTDQSKPQPRTQPQNQLFPEQSFKREHSLKIPQPRTYSEKKYYAQIIKSNETILKKVETWTNSIRPVMLKMIQSLIEQKSKHDPQVKYKKELQTSLISMFKDIYESSIDHVESMLNQNKKALSLKLNYAVPTKVLNQFEKQAFKITGDVSQDMLDKAKKVLSDSIKGGLSEEGTVTNLSEVLDQFSKSRLATIVRTNINAAWNRANLEQFRDPDLEGFVQGVEFSALLDNATTPQCEALDGKQYRSDDPYVDQINPPIHFNCRSTLIPITLEDKFNEAKKVEINPVDSDDPNGFQELGKEK